MRRSIISRLTPYRRESERSDSSSHSFKTSYYILWADSVPGPVYRILRYAKLDSNLQASPFVTIAGMNVPRSTGLFKAGSGLAVGWFSSAGVYLSPLCP